MTLFVEGVNESASGEVRIEVVLDPDGPGGSPTTIDDAVRLTAAWLEVDFRDVTGLEGIGNTTAASVPRVPVGVQPDGIATDWQNDVDDGAILLMRVIGSEVLQDLIDEGSSGMMVDFGYVPEMATAFAALPGSPGREGAFKELTDTGFVATANAALGGLGIETIGASVGPHSVLDARFYTPPVEFDLNSPLSTKKERKLNLAVNVTGKVEGQGSKPHAIALVRPPLVLVHGVNSGLGVWATNADGATFVEQFDTGGSNWGFIADDFRVRHNEEDPARSGEGATLGFGEISNMYSTVRDMIHGTPDSAKTKFHDGDFFEPIQGSGVMGKRIAIQKVDIVAHSYGGLLSRWYIEQAGSSPGEEFSNRKDVRKLITLGTPHRGSPLANMVCEVLNGGLISGADAEGVAEQNTYIGSSHTGGPGAIGTGAGLHPSAIVKVELSPTNPFEATFGTDMASAGPRPIALTGMMPVGQIGTAQFTIVADEVFDETLHEMGALGAGSLGIPAGQLAGAGGGDYVAYRITSGRIGRRQDPKLTGPDGGTSGDDEHFIGYETSVIPGTQQSPPTRVLMPDYVLPPLTKGGPGNLTISFSGSAEARDSGSGSQTNELRIKDDDGLFNPDETLEIINQVIPHPGNVRNGVLLPFSGSVVLFLDANGYVAGSNDSSSEAPPAELYLELIEPGFVSNPVSTTITVP